MTQYNLLTIKNVLIGVSLLIYIKYKWYIYPICVTSKYYYNIMNTLGLGNNNKWLSEWVDVRFPG